MSGGGGGGGGGCKRKSTKTKTADDPLHSLFAGEDSFSAVDDLFRAAEDDLLLKLRVGAHSTTRPAASGLSPASTSSLDPDLLLRLEALKSPPPPPPPSGAAASAPAPAPASAVVLDDEWGAILGDDLAARFAALKGSSASGSISIHDVAGSAGPIATRVDMKLGASKEDDGGVSEEEDEVEKLLQWAMDAARLDTADSKNNNNDDDDDADSKSEDDDDVEDDDDEKESRRKNGAGKVLLQPPLLFPVPHLLRPPLLLRPQLQPRTISSST